MTVTQPSTGAQRKASRSPPKQQRRTDPQTSAPEAPLQTMTAHPCPPHPPTVQRHQGQAAQSVSCCRRRQWQPVQPKVAIVQQQAAAVSEQIDRHDAEQWRTVQRGRHGKASGTAQRLRAMDGPNMGQPQLHDDQGAPRATGVPGDTPGYLGVATHTWDQAATHGSAGSSMQVAASPSNSDSCLQQEVQCLIAEGCEGEYTAKVMRTMEILHAATWAVAAAQPSEQRTHFRHAMMQAKLVWCFDIPERFAQSVLEMSQDQVREVYRNEATFSAFRLQLLDSHNRLHSRKARKTYGHN